jgi:hypothetical protein
LGGAQVAGVLEDYARRIDEMSHIPLIAAGRRTGEALSDLAYASRVRGALQLWRHAAGWLAPIDHETGAQATLPGFAPGAASLDSVLAMQ